MVDCHCVPGQRLLAHVGDFIDALDETRAGRMVEATGGTVELRAGELVLQLAPGLGGSVRSFTHAGQHLMRPLTVPPGAEPHALYSGMFPMLPFANSLRDNRFTFEGRDYLVRPNIAGAGLNYHGSGWQRPWRRVDRGGDHCLLMLDEVEEAPGYAFSGEQHFVLHPDRLDVSLAVTNRSPTRMPFGFGLHPWFPRHGDGRATFAARQVLREDADFQALDLASIPPEEDFSEGRAPARSYRNRCYAGWSGTARIEWFTLGLALVIDAEPVFQHLMFHVPGHDFETFCLEPQSNRTSGFDGVDVGAAAPGVHILEPGETLDGRITFRVERIPAP